MSDSNDNTNDPAFLASRALDESLPAAAKARLDEALDASEDVRSLAMQMEAVDRLVKKWGRRSPDIDWACHEKLIKARVEAIGEEDQLHGVDDLIAKWASLPPIDEHRFESAVMNRIRRERPAYRRRVLFRIGVSLAAAAAIAIVATGMLWPSLSTQPMVQVDIGPPEWFASSDAARTAVAFVSFDRTPRPRDIADRRPVLSFLAVGSSPSGRLIEESPPL